MLIRGKLKEMHYSCPIKLLLRYQHFQNAEKFHNHLYSPLLAVEVEIIIQA